MTQPPTPRSLDIAPSLSQIRGLMARAKRAAEDLHNVTRSTLKAGTKLEYKTPDMEKVNYAKVLEIAGVPGKTRIKAEKISTRKIIELKLEDITGIVQES